MHPFRAQLKTNNNAAQVEIQSNQILLLERKINNLCNENKVITLRGDLSGFKVI